MNKLILKQVKNGNIKDNYPVESVAANVATTLYLLGKDDDSNQTLTFGVDTNDPNRPITSIRGSISIPSIYQDKLEYLETKFPDLKISSNNVYINFQDSKVEEYLLAAGIGDNSGITLANAATASIGTILKGKTDIVSFNEYSYFTISSNNIPVNTFRECSNLQNIGIPTTVSAIGEYAFYLCDKLILNLTQYNNITSIGQHAFDLHSNNNINTRTITGIINFPSLESLGSTAFSCTNISQIENLGKISRIQNSVFSDIPNLISVKLPYECTQIWGSAFQNSFKNYSGDCTIKQYNKSWNAYESGETPILNNLSRITSFGNYCFQGCTKLQLTSDDISGAIEIGTQAFNGTNLSGDIVLNNVTSVGDTSFANTKITSLTLPERFFSESESVVTGCTELLSVNNNNFTNVTRFRYKWFAGCTKLAIDVLNIPNVTQYDHGVFVGTNISQIYAPKLPQNHTSSNFNNYASGSGMFMRNSEHHRNLKLLYLKELTDMYPAFLAGSDVYTLIINNTTCPTLHPASTNNNTEYQMFIYSGFSSEYSFSGGQNSPYNRLHSISKIFVPDGYKSNYQTLFSTQNGFDISCIHEINEIDSTTGNYVLPRVATKADWDLLSAEDKPNTLILEYCGSNHGIQSS